MDSFSTPKHHVLLTLGIAFTGIVAFFVFYTSPITEAASVTSLKSGNWSNPAVWSTGTVPQAGDTVTIAAGHTTTYDVLSDEVIAGVTINGTLYFSRSSDTRLKTSENIVVSAGGSLDTGTPADFIPAGTQVEIIFVLAEGTQFAGNSRDGLPIDMAQDVGLWVMNEGRWDVHGTPLVRAWSKLAANAAAGASSVIVENDVTDWRIGGTAVITSTSTSKLENELRAITQLELLADGTTKITLDSPLSYFHEGTDPFQGEVGLLTRNVRITTEIPGTDMEAKAQNIVNRKYAHTVQLEGSLGNIQYGEFKFLGHYQTLGRYPIHLHQMGESAKGNVVRGNSIWYSGFRWVVIHDSYETTVEDNVGFDAVGTGFFGEASFEHDPTTTSNVFIVDDVPRDTAWVHNLGVTARSKTFGERNSGPAEYWRIGAFWPRSSAGEAHLGNVAVATSSDGESGEASGFWYPETSFGSAAGTAIPGEFFLANEAHSNEDAGVSTWKNQNIGDLVGSFLWRNARKGFSLGAYDPEFFVHKAKLLENGSAGGTSTITDVFVQDSEIAGTGSGTGWSIEAYFAEQRPTEPHWNVRNTYRDLGVGYTQLHSECDKPEFEKVVETVDCGANYSYFAGNTFSNVADPLDFGWHANANSWWKVAGLEGVDSSLQGNFYLNRKDQDVAANQGPESAAIVGDGSNSTYHEGADALLTPIISAWMDYPPTIDLQVTMADKIATMTALVSDDKDVPRVEFFVDWLQVGEVTSAPYEITVDLSQHPRKYAYLWARAFDNVALLQLAGEPYTQRAYSEVIELGPETLLAGEIAPPSTEPSPTQSLLSSPPPPPDSSPPTRLNPSPLSGTVLPAGTTQTTVGLDTDEPALCRYEQTSGVSFEAMTNVFTVSADGMSHSALFTGLEDGKTYSLFVKCQETDVAAGMQPATNADDFVVSFTIAVSLPLPTFSDLSSLVLFLDDPEVVDLIGSGFLPGEEFSLKLKGETGEIELEVQATDENTIEVDFASDLPTLSALPHGFYELEIERSSDLFTLSLETQLLLTKLGDLPDSAGQRDGLIDLADIARMLNHFAKSGLTAADPGIEADINGPTGESDGKIDLFDANKMMANWTGSILTP